MFKRFDAVNSPKIGNGLCVNYGVTNEISSTVGSYLVSSKSRERDGSFSCQDYFLDEMPECTNIFDPMLLDPVVSALTDKSFSLKEVDSSDSGNCDGRGYWFCSGF